MKLRKEIACRVTVKFMFHSKNPSDCLDTVSKVWNESLKHDIFLVCGGNGQFNAEQRVSMEMAATYCQSVYLLPGTLSAQLHSEFSDMGGNTMGMFRFKYLKDYDKIIETIYADIIANQKDAIILFSPGTSENCPNIEAKIYEQILQQKNFAVLKTPNKKVKESRYEILDIPEFESNFVIFKNEPDLLYA